MFKKFYFMLFFPALVVHAQTSIVTERPNLYFITQTDATIYQIPIDYGGKIKIGKGLNYENPENPIPKHNDFLIVPTSVAVTPTETYSIATKTTGNTFKLNSPINFNMAQRTSNEIWYEYESDEEIANALSASFGAGFGFGSFGLSLKKVQNARRSGKIIVYKRESTTSGSEDISELQLNPKYASEVNAINSLTDKAIRTDKFINKFGTHFISSITYGCRIAIYAEMQSNTNTELNEFSANFHLFTANGSFSSTAASYFHSHNLIIKATVTSGEDTPPIYLNSFDEISDFFQALKNGTKQISNAPLSMKITNLRTQFLANQYNKIYSDLSPQYGQAYNSPYGVPKGTILAWYVPNAFALSKDKNTSLSKYIPKGWLVCDGKNNGTPDLTDKFLIGTEDLSKVGTSTGQKQHKHEFTGKTTLNEDDEPSGPRANTTDGETHGDNKYSHWHNLKGNTDYQDNIPPSVYIIYIIKT